MFSIKHFLLGAGIAILPVSFYGYVQLRPNSYGYIRLSPQRVLQPAVLGASTEYQPSNVPIELVSAIMATGPATTVSATPAPTAKPVPVKTTATVSVKPKNITPPGDVLAFIERYASQYGVNKNMMIGIAHCESGFRSNAVNGPYAGLYQFVSSTWSSNRRAMGMDPNPELRFNAEEAVRTAAFKMSRDGFGAWPVCQKKAQTLLTSL